jgi:serine/threonine protein kinase
MYALKNVELTQPDALAEAKMEYDLLRKGIPNVLKSFGSYHEPNKKFIYSIELMEMTLEKHIQSKGQLAFGQFIPIFKDILRGKNNNLFSLKKHKNTDILLGVWGLFNEAKTVHRDLKPENILLNSKGEAVIADLDGAKIYNSINSVQKLS